MILSELLQVCDKSKVIITDLQSGEQVGVYSTEGRRLESSNFSEIKSIKVKNNTLFVAIKNS